MGVLKRLSNKYITTAVVNIVTQPTTNAVRNIITQIDIVNRSASDRTFSLWLGASGAAAVAGTEIMGGTRTVQANKTLTHTFYEGLVQERGKFINGQASAASSLVITVLGYREDVTN